MDSYDNVEPQLNDAIENALIEIFLHLEVERVDTPDRVLDAVEQVELWARQGHSTWRRAGVVACGYRWRFDGVGSFALGALFTAIIFLPEIMGLTCGAVMFP